MSRKYKDRQTYRNPRAPLLKQIFKEFTRVIIGGTIALFFPVQPLNLLGLGLIAWAYISWHYTISPKWNYRVKLNSEFLMINDERYPWKDIQAIRIEKKHGRKILKLGFIFHDDILEIRIRDDIDRFSELIKECVRYAEREDEVDAQDSTIVIKGRNLKGAKASSTNYSR